MTRLDGADQVLTGWGRTAPSRAFVAAPGDVAQLDRKSVV